MSTTTYTDQLHEILNKVKQEYANKGLSMDGKILESGKKKTQISDVNYGFNSLNAKQSKITLNREIRSGRYFKKNTDTILQSLDEVDNRPIGKKWANLIMWDKKQFINNYITCDDTILNEQKEELLTKIYKYLEESKPITKKQIDYDPAICEINNIDYDYFR
jgi:hypothetical protein